MGLFGKGDDKTECTSLDVPPAPPSGDTTVDPQPPPSPPPPPPPPQPQSKVVIPSRDPDALFSGGGISIMDDFVSKTLISKGDSPLLHSGPCAAACWCEMVEYSVVILLVTSKRKLHIETMPIVLPYLIKKSSFGDSSPTLLEEHFLNSNLLYIKKPSKHVRLMLTKDQSFLTGNKNARFSYGYSSFKGKRSSMEDFYETRISEVDGQMVAFFGVFDGHGGSRTAEYLKNNLFKNLSSHPDFIKDTKSAIVESFRQTDVDYLNEEKGQQKDAGSTASTAMLLGDRLLVANVGDSRVVACRAGSAIPLSIDHKPDRSDERQRIEQAGGFIIWAGTWRVGGVLAVSRAFGDKLLKPYVVAEPEIQPNRSLVQGKGSPVPKSPCPAAVPMHSQLLDHMEISRQLEVHWDRETKGFEEEEIDGVDFIIIASDGLWNVLSNKDAVAIVQDIADAEAASRKLIEAAYAKGSSDNITCVVVRFENV
ncbi:hypothetical protein TEA_016787 [Camellia sinensis var. sinensis]|uniref:protein-serine/threonine phosphatase n=1 Tax=Camellia sinensis var. sinensis TaxID=542762 RepID=A0A4S4E006_CAMSN|nr:hypothetical protein TEA_016787 [Camellia sinensis var. sinensis]